MSHENVSSLPASFDAYIRAGWSLVPIPPGTKGPRSPGWNRKENALKSANVLPQGYGVGLAHAYSGTMALDIDDWDQASAIFDQRNISLEALFAALDAVTVESGVRGHGKLIYSMPFGITLPTKKITFAADGQTKVAFELRCASTNGTTVQDVLPPSIHPITNLPYRWGGKGHWSRLPVCPIEILDLWQALIEDDTVKNIKVFGKYNTSWDEIVQALHTIPADAARETWVQIGMALHAAGTEMDDLDRAYTIWDEWSQQSLVKYKGPQDTMACWRSFNAQDGIGVGTLFHHARNFGYSRPIPNAESFFSAVEPTAPKALTTLMAPPPPRPVLEDWPALLRDYAHEVSESVGVDPLVPLMAGLAAVCGAVDSSTTLELMNGYEVPPVLWIMTIGNPADKKSPGSKPMFKVLEEIEIADVPRHKTALLAWELQEAKYASAKKDMLTRITDPLMENDVAMTLPPLPPQPSALQIRVNDITSQMLVRKAAENPRGLVCVLDEMSSWIKKMIDPRSGEDRSAWVQSYEADRYKYDRVSAGSIHVERFAVSIYGNVQPKVFQKFTEQMSDDGLLQRFIPVCLDTELTRVNDPVNAWLSRKPQYENMIRQCFTLPARKYTLSSGAYEAYRAFQHWYQRARRDEQLLISSDIFMTAFGKMEGLAGRLALVFHLIEDPYASEVSRECMERVIRVIRSFIVPSMRYAYNVLAGEQTDSVDKWMIDHILHYSGEVDTLSLAQIKHSMRRRNVGKSPQKVEDEIRTSMSWLESNGWVSLAAETRRGVTWVINKKLAELYSDRRREVVDAKQRQLNEIYDTMVKHHGVPASAHNPKYWLVPGNR